MHLAVSLLSSLGLEVPCLVLRRIDQLLKCYSVIVRVVSASKGFGVVDQHSRLGNGIVCKSQVVDFDFHVLAMFRCSTKRRERQSNCLGFDSMERQNLRMPHWLTTMLQVIIGSGLGAGFVTFILKFWKAERDFRRAKLEELYAAVHKYTLSISLVTLKVTTSRLDPLENQSELNADFDRINLLIDQLISTFLN